MLTWNAHEGRQNLDSDRISSPSASQPAQVTTTEATTTETTTTEATTPANTANATTQSTTQSPLPTNDACNSEATARAASPSTNACTTGEKTPAAVPSTNGVYITETTMQGAPPTNDASNPERTRATQDGGTGPQPINDTGIDARNTEGSTQLVRLHLALDPSLIKLHVGSSLPPLQLSRYNLSNPDVSCIIHSAFRGWTTSQCPHQRRSPWRL